MTQKAHSIRVVKCGCGRVTIALLDADDGIFASGELDPEQWLTVCGEIMVLSREMIENNVEFDDHDHTNVNHHH
jgi:hypothetical protein